MSQLTARQQEILGFVRLHATTHGYWPSIREIQAHFGFKSTNAVAGHLRALKNKGVIDRVPGQARTLRLLQRGPALEMVDEPQPSNSADILQTDSVPVYGAIAAGYPDGVESSGIIDRIQVDLSTARNVRTRDTFALRVRGDSMIDAGIFDGDVVIVEPRLPRNGDIVAALIDGATTLKRFIDRAGSPPYLKAENPGYPELHPLGELIIQGVATSVVRKLT
jgi:repressor LexA